MTSALAKTLGRAGHQVGLVTPLYLGIRERFPALKRLDLPLDLPLGNQRIYGEIWTLEPTPGLTIYFVDQPQFYQRDGIYQKYGVDYPDNAERFLFFSKAAAHLAFHLPWKPEIFHAHDWQAAFSILFIQHQLKLPGWHAGPRTALTIHNLAYQGVFPMSQYALTNLPWDYFTLSGVEFYGQMNFLKAGIAFADLITTVSPRYAREITTEEFGGGLDGLLRDRQSRLVGILNGVDYDEWNPATDPALVRPFSADDLSGKAADKADLQGLLGLPVEPRVPVFGSIGRLVAQKGVDIMLGALHEMLAGNLQFVLLGSGAPVFERAYEDLGHRFKTNASIRVGFDEKLSHRIEAGCDFFLMPSQFEPCGLNQMYSLRYGTIPIVRRTGGLDDSVVDIRDDATRANGIKFGEHSAAAVAKAMRKGMALYEQPELFNHYRQNAMAADFSWERTTKHYERVYAQILIG